MKGLPQRFGGSAYNGTSCTISKREINSFQYEVSLRQIIKELRASAGSLKTSKYWNGWVSEWPVFFWY